MLSKSIKTASFIRSSATNPSSSRVFALVRAQLTRDSLNQTRPRGPITLSIILPLGPQRLVNRAGKMRTWVFQCSDFGGGARLRQIFQSHVDQVLRPGVGITLAIHLHGEEAAVARSP